MKNFWIIAFASLGPALPVLLLDPGFGLFVAPVCWGIMAVLCAALWFLLALFRCPKNARLLVILAGCVVLTVWFGFWAWHAQTAEGRLERLLVHPLPESVKPLHAESAIGMAGGYEVIAFSVAPSDLDDLISSCGFVAISYPPRDPGFERNRINAALKKIQIEPESAYRSGNDMDERFLIVNAARDRAILFRSRM